MSKLLALDTSTLRAAVAVADVEPGRPTRSAPTLPGPPARHGRNLLPVIRDLLAADGLRVGDVGVIAVGIGPGSYTGLRIGLTAAKTLAYAAGAALISLDSLEAIAWGAPPDATDLAVVADAQRGDGYVAEFRRDPAESFIRLSPTRIEPVATWAATLTPGTLVLGPALDRLAIAWPEGVRLGSAEQGHPGPEAVVELARREWNEGRTADLWKLEPAYFRRSAAEDQWDRKP